MKPAWTALASESSSNVHERLLRAADHIATVVLGKDTAIRLAMACLLARGHLLIEDLPGMGKTLLAQTLARALGLEFRRIQFTSDLLPSDILGAAVFLQRQGTFVFKPGPIFTELVLADEINRATAKTQSALLEAMAERQVTVDGDTRVLPQPFFVIATQNPCQQLGTFPLPESQSDRFLMSIALGYPDAEAERELLQGRDRRTLLEQMPACLSSAELLETQALACAVHASGALLDYVQGILGYTRHSGLFRDGLSPRAGLALLAAARAWALLECRDYLVPEDVQAVLPAVCSHRLRPNDEFIGLPGSELLDRLATSVPLPA